MTNQKTITFTPAMRADIARQPHMTQAEANATWLRVQMQTEIVALETALAVARWSPLEVMAD